MTAQAPTAVLSGGLPLLGGGGFRRIPILCRLTETFFRQTLTIIPPKLQFISPNPFINLPLHTDWPNNK